MSRYAKENGRGCAAGKRFTSLQRRISCHELVWCEGQQLWPEGGKLLFTFFTTRTALVLREELVLLALIIKSTGRSDRRQAERGGLIGRTCLRHRRWRRFSPPMRTFAFRADASVRSAARGTETTKERTETGESRRGSSPKTSCSFQRLGCSRRTPKRARLAKHGTRNHGSFLNRWANRPMGRYKKKTGRG